MGVLDLTKIRAGDALLKSARRLLNGRPGRPVPLTEIMIMNEEKPVYTTDEVGELLTVNPQTVRKWIREGELDASKIGRGYRIDRPALERFWQARGGTRLFTEDAGAGD